MFSQPWNLNHGNDTTQIFISHQHDAHSKQLCAIETVQTTDASRRVPLSIPLATLKSKKREVSFNNTFCLTQYIQNIIVSTSNHYKVFDEIFCILFLY